LAREECIERREGLSDNRKSKIENRKFVGEGFFADGGEGFPAAGFGEALAIPASRERGLSPGMADAVRAAMKGKSPPGRRRMVGFMRANTS